MLKNTNALLAESENHRRYWTIGIASRRLQRANKQIANKILNVGTGPSLAHALRFVHPLPGFTLFP